MNNLTKKLEVATNVAILFTAALVCAILIQRFVLPHRDTADSAMPNVVKVGDRVSIDNVDWKSNKRTLLLAFAPECHFCTASAPFYRQLVEKTSGGASPHFIGVFPSQLSDGRTYLKGLGVKIADVRGASFRQLHVLGTPTLMLVNADGVATNVWEGRLPPDKETEVFRAVE